MKESHFPRNARVLGVSVERGYACRIELSGVGESSEAARTKAHRDEAVRLYLAYYSPAVIENGWQPYDQPSPSAYMPLGYAESVRERVRDGGEILVQRMPDCIGDSPVRGRARASASVRSEVEAAFRRAGAPLGAAVSAMKALRRAQRELSPESA